MRPRAGWPIAGSTRSTAPGRYGGLCRRRWATRSPGHCSRVTSGTATRCMWILQMTAACPSRRWPCRSADLAGPAQPDVATRDQVKQLVRNKLQGPSLVEDLLAERRRLAAAEDEA